jgi:hypothetical protein
MIASNVIQKDREVIENRLSGRAKKLVCGYELVFVKFLPENSLGICMAWAISAALAI